jgi:uncharacterized C2H2 Zn-finger protein
MPYVKCKENVVANALSRCPLVNVISRVRNTMTQDIKKYHIVKISDSKKLTRTLKNNIKPMKKFKNIRLTP